MNKRLKIGLKKLGMTLDELAKKIDVPKSKVRNMSAGWQKITPEIAIDIEKQTGISSAWLLLNKGDIFEKDGGMLDVAFDGEKSLDSRMSISLYLDPVAIEDGFTNNDDISVDVISIPKSILNKNLKVGKVVAIKYHSDSMFPTVKKDDVLIIDINSTDITNNKIYFLKYYNEIKVCRIFKRKGANILLRDDNEIYPDEELNVNEIEIMGEVIYLFGSIS